MAKSTPRDGRTAPEVSDLRSRNRERTYDEIYESAMELFMRRGYEEVSVEEICAAAGVGRATFFRYFGTKFALVDEFNRRLSAKIRLKIRVNEESPSHCLRQAALAVHEHWVNSAPQFRILSKQFLSSQVHLNPDTSNPDMAMDLRDAIAEFVRAGQADGSFKGDDSPEVVASLILWGWTAATSTWFETNDEKEYRRSIRSLTELFIAGLENQPASD